MPPKRNGAFAPKPALAEDDDDEPDAAFVMLRRLLGKLRFSFPASASSSSSRKANTVKSSSELLEWCGAQSVAGKTEDSATALDNLKRGMCKRRMDIENPLRHHPCDASEHGSTDLGWPT